MKKILVIANCLDVVGGVERIMNVLIGQLSINNNVTIINKLKLTERGFFDFNANVKKEYILDRVRYSGILAYMNKIYGKIGRGKIIHDMLMKYFDTDVIIFDRVHIALEFLPIIKRMNIQAKVIVRDAIHLEYFSSRAKRKMLKYFPEMVDTFIVSSDESRLVYEKFFNKSIKIIKLYNPIGITPMISKAIGKRIISIGRMDDNQKGFDVLVRSFGLVHQRHPDWKLEIYGDGKERKKIESLVFGIGLDDCVKILPTAKDVVSIFNKASIFVLASRCEGYANILVEAMCCGVPCISYDWLMGVDEIIENNKNGIVVPLKNRYEYFKGGVFKEDIYNMAEAINQLIDDENMRQRLSHNASGIINGRTVEHIVSRWEEVIYEIK